MSVVDFFLNKDKNFLIGSVIFAGISIIEFFTIYLITPFIGLEYIIFVLVWLGVLIFNWKFILENLKSNVLTAKYKLAYKFLLFVLISLSYLILIYPIRPSLYLSNNWVLNVVPAYMGMITALFATNSFVYRDITSKKRSGKYFWQIKDDNIKSYEKYILVLIIGIVPLIFLVILPLSLLISTLLQNIDIPYIYKILFIALPVYFFGILWIIALIKLNNKIKIKRQALLRKENKFF